MQQKLLAVVSRVLASASAVNQYPRLTVTDREVGAIHYDTSRGFVYLIVTEMDYPQRTAFKCIGALRDSFTRQFGEQMPKMSCVPSACRRTPHRTRSHATSDAGARAPT